MATNKYLSIITLNVNGLNAPIKRHRVADWIRKLDPALAGLAQQLERRPVVRRGPGLVPAKGAYLSCSLSLTLVGRAGGSHSMCPFTSRFLCLSLFLSLPPTLPEQKNGKMSLGEDKKQTNT
uniref:Uncharacterized protein n=1 Tax=Molossus molossus TaxID=27622 RepID=A0A7J8GLR8_MOLMO|nr:hypothetical protein HJG59_011538 [Molossus molossus]